MKDLPVVGIESRLKVLSDEKCQKIYDAALTIIADIGMTVPHAEAREMLVTGAGATVEADDVVKIPRDAVAAARDTIPEMIHVYDRNGELAMQLGGTNSYFGTGSDLMSIYDFETGERRPSVLADTGAHGAPLRRPPQHRLHHVGRAPARRRRLCLLPRVLPPDGQQHHQTDGHDRCRPRGPQGHAADRRRVPRRRRRAARQAVLHPVRRAGQPAPARAGSARQAALLRRRGHPAHLLAGPHRRRHCADDPGRPHRAGRGRVALRRRPPPAARARAPRCSPAWAPSSST